MNKEMYYCREWKTWVVYWTNSNGDQVGEAQYFHRKMDAKSAVYKEGASLEKDYSWVD